MRRKTFWLGSVLVLSAMLVLSLGSVQAQQQQHVQIDAQGIESPSATVTEAPNGNIGIGTNAPAGILHVAGSEWFFSPTVVSGLNGSVVGATLDLDSTPGTGGRKYSMISTAAGAAAPAGSWSIWDNTATAYRFVIDPNGNVGVGTTSPRTPLHVFGRISTGQDFASAGAITFFPPDGFAWFHIDNGPAGGRPIGRLRFSFGVNPGDFEIMSMTQGGNVGIGVTDPASKLHVNGRITAHGYDLFSDARLKQDVTPLTGILGKLDKIRAVSFQWNKQAESFGLQAGHPDVGVIAQEVAAVFPELVTARGPEKYQTVDYTKLTSVLLEAVKELKTENETLKRRLEALEKK